MSLRDLCGLRAHREGRASAVVPSALALILFSTTLPAQQPTFRSGVELVQVDVVVLDRDGKHVPGLKASDFAVLDRDEPQIVATFEATRCEAASPSAGRIRRQTIRKRVPGIPKTIRFGSAGPASSAVTGFLRVDHAGAICVSK